MNSKSIIPIAIILGGILVSFAIYMNTTPAAKPVKNTSAIRPVSTQDHILGNPSASVKIIEYSDFSCYYCADFQKTLRRIINDYGPTGDVAWIFRELPLTKESNDAFKIAQAAECVSSTAGNTAFWKFSDIVFSNQPVSQTKLGQYITEAGANPNDVAKCIMSGNADKRILSDKSNAIEIGADGTPYTIILGSNSAPVVVSGAYPYSYIKQEIDAAISASKSK